MKRKGIFFGTIAIIYILVLVWGVLLTIKDVSAQQNTVCCEKTKQGAFCQNVPAEECSPGARQVPTACDSTSFCRLGTCFDSNEGICLDNTPQLVCNDNDGVWNENSPPQCELGCCILGDQAAFVTLVRCKKLSADLGLKTNYDKAITSELECVDAVKSQERGACIFDFEFERTCKFTTKSECEGIVSSENDTEETSEKGTFFKDKLCSAEELGTNCGPTTETLCVSGKDEVYFVDTCGNPANIYDASKINDKEYWTNVRGKAETCGPNSGNILSASCGNCNYLLGSYCRDENTAGKNPTYGDFICADLNCQGTSNGQSYKHGESWCVYDDFGAFGKGENSVGSRFFKHICINGEEVLEACEDFRAEECIEGDINGFSQAACRVNRWQDCTAQTKKDDCENPERRDCFWKEGITLTNSSIIGACLPENPPGLKFWESEEAKNICAQGNANCIVKFEKGLFGDEKCEENCQCLTEAWKKERNDVCKSLGDCGSTVNWIGSKGREKTVVEFGKKEEVK